MLHARTARVHTHSHARTQTTKGGKVCVCVCGGGGARVRITNSTDHNPHVGTCRGTELARHTQTNSQHRLLGAWGARGRGGPILTHYCPSSKSKGSSGSGPSATVSTITDRRPRGACDAAMSWGTREILRRRTRPTGALSSVMNLLRNKDGCTRKRSHKMTSRPDKCC